MPRRKRALKKIALADASETEGLRSVIREKIRGRGSAFARLSDQQREELVNALVRAVGFAKAGLSDITAGKQAKPAAWMLDIFVKDVCDALRAVGVPVLMDATAEFSHAQSFAKELAEAAGLQGHGKGVGNLFKQMQRARKIEKNG